MPDYRITANLPFPVRVNPTAYPVRVGNITWSIQVERVQRSTPDERIASGASKMDLLVDRLGQLAYSRVTATATVDGGQQNAVRSFLDALNRLILLVRDARNEYWIHPLDADDLYGLTVIADGVGDQFFTSARGQGFINAVIGITDDADARLRAEFVTESDPPVWRQIQLDAQDALSLGRDEDCALLAWSALEAACRQSLPGLAFRSGLTVEQLAQELHTPRRVREPPYSYEEAVERMSGGLKIVEVAAKLTIPQIYGPLSVRSSVELPYRLRNRIAHQGVRISANQARRALDAVNFVLNSALTLRGVAPPPATLSWQTKFGGVREDVQQIVDQASVRLVLARLDNATFAMERIGDDLWVRISDAMPEDIAAAHLRSQWYCWHARHPDQPRLAPGEQSGIFLEGIVYEEVELVDGMVCLSEAMLIERQTNTAVDQMAAEVLMKGVTEMAAQPRIDFNDAALVMNSARLAAHLVTVTEGMRPGVIAPLQAAQPDLYRLALSWAKAMSDRDLSDPHSRCSVLQRIHADAMWLDTILVLCPIERIAYGSRGWSIDQAPLRRT